MVYLQDHVLNGISMLGEALEAMFRLVGIFVIAGLMLRVWPWVAQGHGFCYPMMVRTGSCVKSCKSLNSKTIFELTYLF